MIKIFCSVKDPVSSYGNLGDIFGYIIAEYFRPDILRIGVFDKSDIDSSTLMLCGSILEHVKPDKKLTAYGPGFIKYDSVADNLRGNYIFGVRGELSFDKIKRSSLAINTDLKVTSDPGLLIKDIFPEIINSKKKYKVGFVIHSVDRFRFFSKFPQLKPLLIDNYSEYTGFVNRLNQFDVVISSSLHGAIFSHSFGIRCAVIRVGDSIVGGDFKFKDYFSSLNMNFEYMDFSDCVEASDFYDRAQLYPQPNPSKIRQLVDMQYADIEMLLDN